MARESVNVFFLTVQGFVTMWTLERDVFTTNCAVIGRSESLTSRDPLPPGRSKAAVAP